MFSKLLCAKTVTAETAAPKQSRRKRLRQNFLLRYFTPHGFDWKIPDVKKNIGAFKLHRYVCLHETGLVSPLNE
ncbi:hypothetical protein Bpfe_022984, partial [Biomphalaria pfeifferi]